MGRAARVGSHFRRWWQVYVVLLVIIVAIVVCLMLTRYFFGPAKESRVATTGSPEYVVVMYPTNLAALLKADRLVKDKNGQTIGITFGALQELLQNALAQKIKDDSNLQDLLRGPKGDSGGDYQITGSGTRGPRGATGPKGDRGERGPTGAQGLQGPAGKVDSNVASELVEQYLESSAGQQMIASFVAKSVKTTATTKQLSPKIRVPQTFTIEVERTDEK